MEPALRWTLDPVKAASNRAEHGLSFDLAVRVFDDPYHASKPDPRPDDDRWHTVGLVGQALLLVIHTWPEPEFEGDEPVDVVAWFKQHAESKEGYQTRINRALREYVQEQAKKRRRKSA